MEENNKEEKAVIEENVSKDSNKENVVIEENPNTTTKTKKKNPFLMILLVVIIIVAIIALGLLIRLAIVQDGDYFAPIKSIFGISDEKDEDKEKEVAKTEGRMSKLSSAATAKGVSHYRMTLDFEDFVDFVLKAYQNEEVMSEVEDTFGTVFDSVSNNGKSYSVNKLAFGDSNDSNTYYDNGALTSSTEDQIATYLEQVEMMKNYVKGGKILVDLYAKGDEMVQVVLSAEYGDMLENIYEYCLENEVEELEDFENAEEFSDYVNTTLKMYLTKDAIIEAIEEELDSENMNVDIAEIEECIDVVTLDGAFEIYYTFTDDINEAFAGLIEQNADDIEKEGVDPDNFIESFVDYANDSFDEVFKEVGCDNLLKIEKVK